MPSILRSGLCAAVSLLPALAAAQTARPGEPAESAELPATALAPIAVTASTPLLGSGLDAEKVPNATYVLGSRDLARNSEADLTGTLDRWAGSVNLNSTIGNPNQPDLQFRGFTASPLQGLPQGLAVYQNGVRINESFGDTVNWDLIPMIAIDSLNLTSSNPVFGFNALGGAVALDMKNGITHQGVDAELSTGSFGRLNAAVESGHRWGDWSAYAALSSRHDDGWRERMPSHGLQLYTDVGYDDGSSRLHLNLSAAKNYLVGTGPTPAALLELHPRSAPGLNYPAFNRNRLHALAATGSRVLSDSLVLQGSVYLRSFRQALRNGNVTDAEACEDDPSTFCTQGQDDAALPLYDQFGRRVPLAAGGERPATIDSADTSTDSRGAALMLTRNAPLFGHDNHFVAGASLDRGDTRFHSGAEMGWFDDARYTHGSGLFLDSDGAIRQVRLDTANTYVGLYASDTFDVDERLSVTASARYNHAQLRLRDRHGHLLNGDHRYERLNPGLGATYRLAESTTAYVNYAEANRTPTAAELSCADPELPCTLASFFMADPPLAQVVSRTWETGLRGRRTLGDGRLDWNVSMFRTTNSDDILEIASAIPGRGYFQNAGTTRRQGVEINTAYRDAGWRLFANLAVVDATYRSPLVLDSPNNPFADEQGLIYVGAGDAIPGIPKYRIKFGADYALTPAWTIGASLQAMSNQVLFQDQSNQTPRLGGYAVASLFSNYALNSHAQLFASIDNLFDRRYATYGTWTNADGVPFPQLPGGSIGITRAYGAAPPRSVIVGLRVKL